MKETIAISNFKQESRLSMWLSRDNALISLIVEEKVTNRQMIHIAHCCISFCMMVIVSGFSVLCGLIGLLWFVSSLFSAKKGGLK